MDIPADKSVLEGLRDRGIPFAGSCECGICELRLEAAELLHRDLVLAEAEKQTHVMACLSRAAEEELTPEFQGFARA